MAPSHPQMASPGEEDLLFRDIIFHIVQSPKLLDATAHEIAHLLLTNGAKEAAARPITPHSRVAIDFQEVTHIIAADIDFPGYANAEDLMIPVVTPEWVKVSLQKKRVAQLRPYTPDPRYFFSGVTATVAELPAGDKEAICGGIIAMGGQFSNNLTKFTTHIVALNMDNEKCKQALAKKLKLLIVLPHWFDDCLKLGRRIPEDPYTLPNPTIEVYDGIKPLPLPKGPDLSYSHAHNGGPMSQDPPPPRLNFRIFENRRVKLGDDLHLGERLRKVISQIIEQTKGTVTDNINEADVYIGHYRESNQYMLASRRAITVGNLTWLYWMFAHGEWTSPLRRLLHYPIARGGLPGMQGQMITVSNYGGDARLYLENLIEAAGAKFTKSMKAENTHLITARAQSEKCTAAKEWNIHMINHLWLEESYAKWQVQSLAVPKYTHFPPCTNLMEVVGQTSLDPTALEQFYLDDEILDVQQREPFSSAVSQSAATARLQSQTTRTPTLSRVARRDTSDPPPSTSSGSRKAKEQAVARLHDQIMPDVALYEKEQKRKGGVLGGGRRRRSVSSPIEEKKQGRKRTASVETADGDSTRASKKGKKRPKPIAYLLITGHKEWLNYPKKADSEKKLLEDLGIQCVNEPSTCTHLAAPQIVRTEKFCCALARAPIVVSTKWIDACVHEERIVETDPYLLHDREAETRLGIDLSESLRRARGNGGKLLKGQAIYCTEGVHGGYETCRKIVEANGGVCVAFKMVKRAPNVRDCEKLVLLSGEDAADKRMWSAFKKVAASSSKEPVIYKMDWLLEVAMTQKVSWDRDTQLG